LFNEITKSAVQEAINTPLKLNQSKFESQQARRILDRLVGYKISPILWEKVRRGLSAGRVQSVAVRLIVDREREIEKFVAEEYWTVEAELLVEGKGKIISKLVRIDGEKAEIGNQAEADQIMSELQTVDWSVANIKKSERKRKPTAPFITSKLQQEAARKLRFTAKKTMMLAQRLYEGIEIGEEGLQGLITYMRTDSTRVSGEAVTNVRSFIETKFGKEYLPAKPNEYKTKKSAQDAHEAIRPTSMELPPEKVKPFLEKDQYRLYELIWNRFVASQMNPAVYDQTTIDFGAGERFIFRATGSILRFKGFMAMYLEGEDEKVTRSDQVDEYREGELPDVKESDGVSPEKVTPNQHFTQPPPRFTESSLVKELEERGIGRPSTYASILSVIQDKEYVIKDNNRFMSSELGRVVTELLVESFPAILDVEFTAQMEEKLDKIEEGHSDWVGILREFYDPFEKSLTTAREEMRNVKREATPTDIDCDRCNNQMVIKWGRNGQFLACSTYPDCKNTKEFKRDADGNIQIVEDQVSDKKCKKCGADMLVKNSRYGRFLGCSNYPDCDFTAALTIGIGCPKEGCAGEIVERRTRRGRIFFGCSAYPDCDFASWDEPVVKKCELCGFTVMGKKKSKTSDVVFKCLNKDCGNQVESEETEANA
jgi:DNA topoisomerase-1